MIKMTLILILLYSTLALCANENIHSIDNAIKSLERSLLYGNENTNTQELTQSTVENLFKKQESNIFKTNFSNNNLKVIFNSNFENMALSTSQKAHIEENYRRNGFLEPNIIHLSYMQNKSFSYTFFQNGFYESPLKDNVQKILFFHEIAHFFASENINFTKEFSSEKRSEYKFKTYIDESFADIFSIVFLTRNEGVTEQDLPMFFNGLIKYRKINSHFLYASEYSLELFKLYYLNNYQEMLLMSDKDLAFKLYELNKKILLSNYSEELKILLKDKNISIEDNISIQDFFKYLTDNNITLNYNNLNHIFTK